MIIKCHLNGNVASDNVVLGKPVESDHAPKQKGKPTRLNRGRTIQSQKRRYTEPRGALWSNLLQYQASRNANNSWKTIRRVHWI